MKPHWHWQNLNEHRPGVVKGWPWHGRCWLNFGRTTLRAEWSLWSGSCRATFGMNPAEGEMLLSLALPPISLHFAIESWALVRPLLSWMRPKHDPRSFGIRVFDWALWWSFYENEHCSSSKDPWWQRGRIRPGELFGKWIYKTTLLDRRDIVVPMPEGEYRGTAELRWAIRGHKWSPLKHRNREVEIKLEKPIPFSGKGENAWDCGLDGLYGMTCPARSIEDAIGQVVAGAMETRRKRGDPITGPEEAAA